MKTKNELVARDTVGVTVRPPLMRDRLLSLPASSVSSRFVLFYLFYWVVFVFVLSSKVISGQHCIKLF